MSRPWPVPNRTNTLHLMGDTQSPTRVRQEIVTRDMQESTTIPDVDHRIVVGDFVNGFGSPASFPEMIEFVGGLGTGQWWSAVGNHDYDVNTNDPSPDDAAANMGMPGKNYVVDLGYAVAMVFFVPAVAESDDIAPDTTWLRAQLDTYADRVCLIVAHPPLFIGHVITAEAPVAATAVVDALSSFFTANPTARVAWCCGHTHTAIERPGLMSVEVIAGHVMPQLNGSALIYTIPDDVLGGRVFDRLCTTWLTVTDTGLEVRFRDHAARQWVSGTDGWVMVWTHTW